MLNEHDLKKLQGVHPDVAHRLEAVFHTVTALTGYLMLVTDGVRTVGQQQSLFAQGRTVPGRIVTHCDGVQKLSNHQSGRAVDCCFIVAGKPSWDEHLPWAAYGAAAEAEGFHWGGRWLKPDRPHIELPSSKDIRDS